MNEKNNCGKTLQDILNRERLERQAVVNWFEMPLEKRKQKAKQYNHIIQEQWNVQEDLKWDDDYFKLNEFQKRLLLKRELVNAYNMLSTEDKQLLQDLLQLETSIFKWHLLNGQDKRKIIRAVFNFI